MKFELPLRNFRIHRDGNSTAYDERSLVNTSESSAQSFHRLSIFKSRTKNQSINSSPKILIRTRATSNALEKLLSHQAKQLSTIGEIWRSKFASSPYTLSNPQEKLHLNRNRATSDALTRIMAKQAHHLSALEEVWREKFLKSSSNLSSQPGQMIENTSSDDELIEEEFEFENDETDNEFCMRMFNWLENLPDLFNDMELPEGDFEDYFEDEDQ